MSYEKMGAGELDYEPCRYGGSRLVFRGPRQELSGDYVIFLGGTETYGKFVPEPFPVLLQEATGRSCVNFGYVNAGVDVFLAEPVILEAVQRASLTIVQVLGAHNMSNRYYKVHPRRNDRFVEASSVMRMVFRDVDFTEFHFTRHMLGTLLARAPDRFTLLCDELKAAWVARMKLLLTHISGPVLLLWVSDHAPVPAESGVDLKADPLLIDTNMLDELRPHVDEIVEVVTSSEAQRAGTAGMIHSALEKPAAQRMLGPLAHIEVADRLAPYLAKSSNGR